MLIAAMIVMVKAMYKNLNTNNRRKYYFREELLRKPHDEYARQEPLVVEKNGGKFYVILHVTIMDV